MSCLSYIYLSQGTMQPIFEFTCDCPSSPTVVFQGRAVSTKKTCTSGDVFVLRGQESFRHVYHWPLQGQKFSLRAINFELNPTNVHREATLKFCRRSLRNASFEFGSPGSVVPGLHLARWNKACSCMHQVIISVMVLALLDSRRVETSETVQWTCKIRCMSQAGAAAYAASCAQDFPDASELIEELFERWDRRRNHRSTKTVLFHWTFVEFSIKSSLNQHPYFSCFSSPCIPRSTKSKTNCKAPGAPRDGSGELSLDEFGKLRCV